MFERVLNTPVLWNITICRLHIQKCKQNHYTELPIRLFQGHLCNELFRLFMGMQWWNWSCKTTITTDHVTLYILHIKQIVSGYKYCTSKKLKRERESGFDLRYCWIPLSQCKFWRFNNYRLCHLWFLCFFKFLRTRSEFYFQNFHWK